MALDAINFHGIIKKNCGIFLKLQKETVIMLLLWEKIHGKAFQKDHYQLELILYYQVLLNVWPVLIIPVHGFVIH